ncbi:MAG: calcium/sodium antiporter [Candidatus Margulisiibacteriota bacterium]
MLFHLFLFIISFYILWKAADYFVAASHAIAVYFKLPPILIGATIVAFGTSAPELFVTGFAAYLNQPEVVYGNVLGSNIANLLLIFGLSMVLIPVGFSKQFKFQLRINVICLVLFLILFIVFSPSRFLAGLLLILFLIFQFFQLKKEADQPLDAPENRSLIKSISIFVLSLIFLILSSRMLVFEVLNLANLLNISKAFISLFAVAFGTSLPELVTTLRFIQRGHSDVVIGNVFGSNLFNLAFVLPMAWFINPVFFPNGFLFEIALLLFIYFFIIIFIIFFSRTYRFMGWLFFIMYFAYIGFIYLK